MGCRLFGQERLPNQAEKVDTEQDLGRRFKWTRGYGFKTGISGFAGGWMGVGIDEYGNYANEGAPKSRVSSSGRFHSWPGAASSGTSAIAIWRERRAT